MSRSGRPLHIGDAQRRTRLVARHHLDGTAPGVEACVAALVALHSSDPATPFLSLAARAPGVSVEGIEQALYRDRTLWRLHSIRRTIWVVPSAFGPTMLGAATVRIAAQERRRLLGWVRASVSDVDAETWLHELTEEILEVLDDAGEGLSTRELGQAVPELTTKVTLGRGRYTQQASVASRLLYLLAMDGLITRGAPLGTWRASQYRWARTERWFDQPPQALAARDPAAARTDLLRAYLDRFGPATTDDVRWWTGWTVAHTTAALAALDAVAVTTDDGPAWLLRGDDLLAGRTEDPPGANGPRAVLLPSLDPTTMGWRQRGHYLTPDLAAFGGPLVDRNGNAGPTVWVDGRVVGAWAHVAPGEVATTVLADIDAEGRQAVEAAAGRMGRWLGDQLDDQLVVTRFPTTAERGLTSG